MIDDIVWGNPTQRTVTELEKKTIIDELFEVFSEMPFPKNSSIAVKQELNQLVDYVSQLKDNEEFVKRYRYYDFGIERLFNKVAEKQVVDKELVNSLLSDIIPLSTKLKFYFQRPRPYQLAQFYKLKLFPYPTITGNTPSYPSTTTLVSYVICKILSIKYDAQKDYFIQLHKDIAYSRLYLGLNYPSDIDFSTICGEMILSNDLFIAKYIDDANKPN
jgi:hypothetical protein